MLVLALMLAGCSRYEPSGEIERSVSGREVSGTQETEEAAYQTGDEESQTPADSGEASEEIQGDAAGEPGQSGEEEPIIISTYPPRSPVKVKGIYVSAYVAGTEDRMNGIIEQIDATELNAVVIDVKDD